MKILFLAIGVATILVAGPALAQAVTDPLDPGFWTNLFGVSGMIAGALVVGWRLLDAGARLIPDSAGGALGFLRWLLRVLSITPPANTN